MERKELIIDLGYIGHKAEKLQGLFEGYSYEPNENGYFLLFSNNTSMVVNQGVRCWTNCFESEEEFRKVLLSKLLFSL
jgi:hypothetical protein